MRDIIRPFPHSRREVQAEMRIKLFNYEIHFFVRDRQGPRASELADSDAHELLQTLGESRTLINDVFAQADLRDAEVKPATDINPHPCPAARTGPPPKVSPQE